MMKINEIDYYFKVREDKDVALNMGVIYKDLGYSKINKDNISKIYNITSSDIDSEYYLNNILSKVQSLNKKERERLSNICEQLKIKWEAYKAEYFSIISDIFCIDINGGAINHTYCYLHLLPINEINLKDHIIYLDANNSVDEIFKNFIIMLTKALLLYRWNDVNNWDFNTEFDVKNKIWMFADIAVDAVFNNSGLVNICREPSYKYFYNIKVDNKNIMQEFRDLFKNADLDEFFTEVYIFIHNNYQTLSQFKNYLY